jgi:hypothetical protein
VRTSSARSCFSPFFSPARAPRRARNTSERQKARGPRHGVVDTRCAPRARRCARGTFQPPLMGVTLRTRAAEEGSVRSAHRRCRAQLNTWWGAHRRTLGRAFGAAQHERRAVLQRRRQRAVRAVRRVRGVQAAEAGGGVVRRFIKRTRRSSGGAACCRRWLHWRARRAIPAARAARAERIPIHTRRQQRVQEAQVRRCHVLLLRAAQPNGERQRAAARCPQRLLIAGPRRRRVRHTRPPAAPPALARARCTVCGGGGRGRRRRRPSLFPGHAFAIPREGVSQTPSCCHRGGRTLSQRDARALPRFNMPCFSSVRSGRRRSQQPC